MNCKDVICDPNNIYEAYLRTINTSKWKETTQKFRINFLRNIFMIKDELENLSYIPNKEGEFVLNERGKIRQITTLCPRDRLVRHILCDNLFIPEIRKKIIYDNASSLKRRGLDFARRRIEKHLHNAYSEYGTNEIYALFGDFSKFYDNIIHEIAKDQLLKLFRYDTYLKELLDIIFKNFEVDVSYMNDEDFENALFDLFNKLEYRKLPKQKSPNKKMLKKSINIGDQISQVIGVYYPNRIDTYIKFVKGMKYYGRYMDDFYIINDSKEELSLLLKDIYQIANDLGIHLNKRKTKIIKLNKPFKYLQIKYTLTNTGKLIKRINPKRVQSMKKKLKKLKIKLDAKTIMYEDIERMFLSWMGSFYKLLSRNQKEKLLKLYENLYDCKISFCKSSGKWKMVIERKDEYGA